MIAVITGITGQDGAYLAQLLLDKGYTVFGTYRRTSSTNFWRIEELGIHTHPNLHLCEYDLTDISCAIRLLESTKATEVYNLAAQSHVQVNQLNLYPDEALCLSLNPNHNTTIDPDHNHNQNESQNQNASMTPPERPRRPRKTP